MPCQVGSARAHQPHRGARRPGTPACPSHSTGAAGTRPQLCTARGEALLAPGKGQDQAPTTGFIKPGCRLLLEPGKKLAASELQARESP